MTYSLVLPFHDDVSAIVATAARARREGGRYGVRDVILAHAGAKLSPEATRELDELVAAATGDEPEVRFLDTTSPGLGPAYELGIQAAREEFVVLSADDLPFGWSDLIAFERAGRPDFAIGTRARRDAELTAGALVRSVAPDDLDTLRRLLLGWESPAGTHGSLIVRAKVAQALLPGLVAEHPLGSLEPARLHLRDGGRIVELVVRLERGA